MLKKNWTRTGTEQNRKTASSIVQMSAIQEMAKFLWPTNGSVEKKKCMVKLNRKNILTGIIDHYDNQSKLLCNRK